MLYKKAQRTAQPPTLAVYLNPGGVQQELVVGGYKGRKKIYVCKFSTVFFSIFAD
jgi:hypothetical protein